MQASRRFPARKSYAAHHLEKLAKLCSSELPFQLDTIYTNGDLKKGLQLRDFDALSHCLRRLSTLVQRLQTALMTDRNSLVPVSRLPNEIICQILSLLEVRSLITATHVCSRWRHAALADASLWGAHVCELPASTPAMLKRSGEVGIEINWEHGSEIYDLWENPPRKVDMTSLRLALAQSYRATHIGLVGHGKLITNALSKITTEAPILRSMKLSDNCSPFLVEYCISSDTFNGSIPQLRRLELDHISCSSNLFRNLTHLTARRRALGENARDLLVSMSRLPASLEVLEIDEAFTALDSEDIAQPEGKVLTFPSLRKFGLKTTTSCLLWIMRRLSFQRQLRLKLEVAAGHMEVTRERGFASYMPLRTTSRDSIFIGALKGLSINSDRYDNSTHSYLHVDAWYSLAEPLLASSTRTAKSSKEPAPEVGLSLLIPISAMDHLGFCLRVLGTPCLENVTFLRLVASDRCASLANHLDSTIELFIHLPSLRSCVLVGDYVGVFVKALADSVIDGPEKPHDGLEELIMADFDCGNSKYMIDKFTGFLLEYAQSRNGGLKRVRLVNPRGIGSDAIDDLFQRLRMAGVADVSV